jgi:hypothetical protein
MAQTYLLLLLKACVPGLGVKIRDYPRVFHGCHSCHWSSCFSPVASSKVTMSGNLGCQEGKGHGKLG